MGLINLGYNKGFGEFRVFKYLETDLVFGC
jgi:hypothetical protein